MPTIATVFFFIFFCYVIYSVFKKTTEKEYDEYANIPLKDDELNKNSNKNNLKKLKNTKNE